MTRQDLTMKKKTKNSVPDPHTARVRAEAILKVRGGLMTASEAAKQLGMSRKTYYKWEKRGLAGLMNSLTNQPTGRPLPPPADLENERLRKQLGEMENQLQFLEKKMELKDIVHEFLMNNGSPGSEKK